MNDRLSMIRGLALALFILSLGGCRFGNYADAPTPNFKDTYQSVELFFTQPAQLSTTVVFNDNTANENTNAPLSAIPEPVQNTFTNPLYFAIPIDTHQYPMFIGLDQSSYVTTQVAPDGTVTDDYLADPVVFWDNPNCTTQIEIVQNGKLDRTNPGTVTFSDGSVSPVSGRLQQRFTYLRSITGDCEAELQMLADCYSSGVGCTKVELRAAKDLFDLYVRQTGVLNISNAKHVRGLVYEVQFE